MPIAILMVLAVAGLVLFIATRPAAFRVARSATMAAPPDVVFGLLADFHQWSRWSPWEKLDPQMNKTFEGAPSGAGASYLWKGNSKAGEGRMTIVESKPPERLAIRLEFLRPFAATNHTVFTVAPTAQGSVVDWEMTGDRTFMFKAFGLLVGMDKMVGRDFEEGLANLKKIAQEGRAGAPEQATEAARGTPS